MESCKVCGEKTPNGFNINFKLVAICECCANSITLQQVNYLVKSEREITTLKKDIVKEFKRGGTVRCISRYKQNEACLTIGKEYPIHSVKNDTDFGRTRKFTIIDDNGRIKKYNQDNSQFELI